MLTASSADSTASFSAGSEANVLAGSIEIVMMAVRTAARILFLFFMSSPLLNVITASVRFRQFLPVP